MKVVVKHKLENIKYPCLMQHEDGTIVLFVANGSGTCLVNNENESYRVREFRNDWCDFTNFKGEINLSND